MLKPKEVKELQIHFWNIKFYKDISKYVSPSLCTSILTVIYPSRNVVTAPVFKILETIQDKRKPTHD